MRASLAVLLLVGCGSVTASSDAVSGAGGLSSDAGGGGGRGGEQLAGGRGGDQAGGAPSLGGAGGASSGGAGGSACVSNNEEGFAFNMTCDGGSPASNGCHASCELKGQHYTGCVDPSDAGPLAFYCYASCSACP